MRRSRIKSPISKITISRVITAALNAGLPIGGVEVWPDGKMRITTSDLSELQSEDLFVEWAGRL